MSKAVAGVAAPATPAAAVAAAAAAAAAAPEMFARDAMIAWFRGEFAAANAIIDALCSHISQITGGGSEYEAAFAAIHRRRMNWIPVIQMQRFYSIADVSAELRRVAAGRAAEEESKGSNVKEIDHEQRSERSAASSVRVSVEGDEEGTEDSSGDSSDHQKVHPEEIVAGEIFFF